MTLEIFVGLLSLGLAIVLAWAFRVLPREQWQVLAAMPTKKHDDGHWQGLNLTWYGVLNANAYTLAVITVFFLLGSLGIGAVQIFWGTLALLALCMPSSRMLARIVEKKRFSFTIGGASFVGILTLPWMVLVARGLGLDPHMTVMAAMAAVSIAYALGEGLGRLACISFGCCYGKPLSELSPALQRIFARCCFIFSGATKKIAYANGWEGRPMLPIQAATSCLYCAAGLAGIYLFLKGHLVFSFIESILITQMWRFASEFFRADYRGGSKISAYQFMSLLASAYGLAVAWLSPESQLALPDFQTGLHVLWQPGLLLMFQALWVAAFLYTGRSHVTGSTISFHVCRDRI